MKVGIISDTHDNTPAVMWIIEYLNQHQILTAFHAGDLINPSVIMRFGDLYKGHLHFVYGNNDGELEGLARRSMDYDNITFYGRDMEIELANKRIFMNHYSKYATAFAKSGDYDICIGGHDHKFRVEQHGECIFINPGNTVTKDKWLYEKREDHERDSSFVILDLIKMDYERVLVEL